MWRRVTALAAVGILSWLAVSGPALAAVSAPDTSAEAGFASRLQSERTSRGLSGLVQAADLVAVARKHASDMASQRRLFDDPALGQEVQSWQAAGENSGTGASVDQVHNAFMASPPHRAIILTPSFTQVGVGVVWTGAQLWVAEVFRQPSGAPARAAPPAPRAPAAPAAPPSPAHSASAAPPAPRAYAAPSPARRAAPTSPAPVITSPTTTALPATSAATSAAAAEMTSAQAPAPAPAAKAQVLAASAFRPPRHARDVLPFAASVAVLLLALDGGLLAQARRRVYTRSKSASRS